ncbi:MAG: patatin-like phospholipase family protein [Pseudobdellovibrionaceae bacterium]|jgi:NTE family protein|nr:patatin-like phospholipase family protein [Pseudobdellovibrionaceae bacterium]
MRRKSHPCLTDHFPGLGVGLADKAIQPVTAASRPTFGIALMGGGSWGAFTAGALEVLLPILESVGDIKVISGTSAGAINATIATSGLNDKGAHEAVRRLKDVWDDVKGQGAWVNHLIPPRNMDFMLSADDRWPNIPKSYLVMINTLQAFNPGFSSGVTQLLSKLVKRHVPNWHSVQHGRVTCAVNTVREHILTKSRQHMVLTSEDMTPDGVAASAALKIMGPHRIWDNPRLRSPQYVYLDGAYEQNPAMAPIFKEHPTDIFVIILNDHNAPESTLHGHAPNDKIYSREIHTDLAQLTLDDSNLTRIHAIEIEMSDGAINGWHLNDTSKMNASPEFIDALYKEGKKAARTWLLENRNQLGQESTYRPQNHAIEELVSHGMHF